MGLGMQRWPRWSAQRGEGREMAPQVVRITVFNVSLERAHRSSALAREPPLIGGEGADANAQHGVSTYGRDP